MTRQQFREFLDGESGHQYLIHDRDCVFSVKVDAALKGFGLRVLKTPVRSPMANAYCERVIGTIRRECLDHMIPLNERHLKCIIHHPLQSRQTTLGPGAWFSGTDSKNCSGQWPSTSIAPGHRVVQTPLLGGLHHEYRLEKEVA
jgi:putative transposase